MHQQQHLGDGAAVLGRTTRMLAFTGGQARALWRGSLYGLGYAYVLQRAALRLLGRGRLSAPVLVSQIYFTGVEALPALALIGLGIGAAVIIQGVSLLPQFGQDDLAYKILIMVITRELGPLLTALFVAARSGSAITTELGNMVVDHEIEAYEAAGVDPIAHLAAPRLVGVMAAMVLLTVYFNVCGLVGSCALASLIHGIPIGEHLGRVVRLMTAGDLASSLVKSVVFGNILATVATHAGFRVDRAVTEVPQKTIQSLGLSMTLCIVAGTVITVLFRLG